jgi:hypothetical protein
MSFEFVCDSCGAVSGPSVGMCPFCKTVLTKTTAESITFNSVQKFYNDGRIDLALSSAQKFYKDKPELKTDVSFMLLYVKILLETEGPTSLINSILIIKKLTTIAKSCKRAKLYAKALTIRVR